VVLRQVEVVRKCQTAAVADRHGTRHAGAYLENVRNLRTLGAAVADARRPAVTGTSYVLHPCAAPEGLESRVAASRIVPAQGRDAPVRLWVAVDSGADIELISYDIRDATIDEHTKILHESLGGREAVQLVNAGGRAVLFTRRRR
jgi:hypothetical protein